MFDSLCGFDDGGQLADALKRDAHDNFGAVWPEWLRLLSKAWKQVPHMALEASRDGPGQHHQTGR